MRRMLLGLAVALAAGAAHAGDLVVVASTDPTIARGTELQSGTKVALAAGKTLVLIDTAGQVVRVTGTARGAALPRRQLAANDDRIAMMKLLVAQPSVRRGRSLQQPVCPEAASLKDIEAILAAAKTAGCLANARQAFGAYVERAVGPLPADAGAGMASLDLSRAVVPNGYGQSARYAQSDVRAPGIARTSVDYRLKEDGLTGSLGFLCGIQPGADRFGGAAAARGHDSHGRFLGAKLRLAFR